MRKEGEFQVKWAGEEGVGGGPTWEFHSRFMEDIQRREIGLWWDEDSRGSMCSVMRLVNGGEESRGDVWRITMWSMSLHAYVDVCC